MKTILLSLFLLSTASLFAQYDDGEKPFHFGVGTALSLPLGDLKTSNTYGIGFEIQPSYSFSENIEGFCRPEFTSFRVRVIMVMMTQIYCMCLF